MNHSANPVLPSSGIPAAPMHRSSANGGDPFSYRDRHNAANPALRTGFVNGVACAARYLIRSCVGQGFSSKPWKHNSIVLYCRLSGRIALLALCPMCCGRLLSTLFLFFILPQLGSIMIDPCLLFLCSRNEKPRLSSGLPCLFGDVVHRPVQGRPSPSKRSRCPFTGVCSFRISRVKTERLYARLPLGENLLEDA